ncbi:paired amphipathic helix protein Sin3-like 2 [Forsythia ovata]|uniref:Paired amphipathic helix protein Sin3-like 2 n=1 Tax=Forsythia ovata TaxID=205694 RepID=A0ABD1S614_9LAMI
MDVLWIPPCKLRANKKGKAKLIWDIEVNILFNGHTDLISLFQNFVPKNLRDRDTAALCVSTMLGKSPDRCRGDDGPIHKVGEDGRKETKACIEFVNRVAKTLDDNYKYKSFLDAVNGLGEGKDIDQVHNEVYLIFKDHPELEIEFSWFLADFYEASGDEVDTNFNFFSRSRRAEGGEVRKKNRYEKILFDCEDQMYEFDMMYHSVESTMRAVDKIVEELKTDRKGKKLKRNEKVTIYIEEYLSVLNLKCLKDLFGEHFVSNMRGNPIDANVIATIMLDLNKKYIELEKYRERAKIKWARTFKENHEKAYNHSTSVKKEIAKRSKLVDPFYRLKHQEEDLMKKKEANHVLVHLRRVSDARHSYDYTLNKALRAKLRN